MISIGLICVGMEPDSVVSDPFYLDLNFELIL